MWVLCSFCGWSSDNGDIVFARADVLSLVIYSPSGEEISDGFGLFFGYLVGMKKCCLIEAALCVLADVCGLEARRDSSDSHKHDISGFTL